MSQKGLAELYQVRIPTINEHTRNILEGNEFDKQVQDPKHQEGALEGALEEKFHFEPNRPTVC